MKKNCATHGHPDCFEPFCVIMEQVKLIVDERDLLRAEIDTAKEEPTIVLKALKNAEAEREEFKKLATDTAREHALVDAEAAKLREQVSAYRKALEGVVEKFEESEPGREDFSVRMCEIAKNALDDTNEKCGANMDGVGGSNHYWCENPKPCSTHPTNESGSRVQCPKCGIMNGESSANCISCNADKELLQENEILKRQLETAAAALKLVDKEHLNQKNWVDLPASHHRVSRARFITADERRAVVGAVDSMRDQLHPLARCKCGEYATAHGGCKNLRYSDD